MYYYLLSKVLHWDEDSQKNDPNYPHAKKNILIFMFGSIAYLFTAGFLWSKQYQPLVQSILPLTIIKDFFLWFMFIDIATCFALYKMFWGYSLGTEIDGIITAKKEQVAREAEIKISQIDPEELKRASDSLLVALKGGDMEEKSKEEVVSNDK
jgi:hypothetical protein